MSERVKFQGTEYWLLSEPDGDFGPIAPLEHCDESGNLLLDAAFYVSFAHLWEDGRISRYGTIIGTREDLELVDAARGSERGSVSKREITYVEVAGRQILAALCICPICKTLDLNTGFRPSDSLDGLIAECPLGHEWEIPKEKIV